MKLAPRDVSGFFTQDRWRDYTILLFFGHAPEMMHSYIEKILQNADIDRADAFTFTRIYGAEIQQDDQLLLHEATSSSLTMQERWILVQGKVSELSCSFVKILHEKMRDRIGENRLIAIFEDLPTKSPLLKKATDLSWVAAIPCYEASTDLLFDEIRQFCRFHDIRATPETENTLIACAENNLMQLKHLLEKVSLYDVKGILEPEIVLACHGNDHGISLQELVYAVFSGDVERSDHLLRGQLEQKIAPVALIRALSQHCMKLQRLHNLASETNLDQAMKKYQPPIFFKQIPLLRQHCRRWSSASLQQLLEQLIEQEVRAKSRQFYDTIILRQRVLRIAKSV